VTCLLRPAQHADAFAGADGQGGDRQCENGGAVALGDIGKVGLEVHAGGLACPDEQGVGRSPFGFADECVACARGLAPVDPGNAVTGRVGPVLPEVGAGACAAAAMGTLNNRIGNALRLDKQRRIGIRQPVGGAAYLCCCQGG
jgi:hypothetical protein